MMMMDSGIRNTEDFSTIWGFALYFLGTMILVIIILNLLISVVGDTFDRVMSSLKEINCKVKC